MRSWCTHGAEWSAVMGCTRPAEGGTASVNDEAGFLSTTCNYLTLFATGWVISRSRSWPGITWSVHTTYVTI